MTQFNNELYAGFLPEAGDARFEGKRGFYPAMTAEEYRALPLPMKCATWDARVQYVIFDSYFRDYELSGKVEVHAENAFKALFRHSETDTQLYSVCAVRLFDGTRVAAKWVQDSVSGAFRIVTTSGNVLGTQGGFRGHMQDDGEALPEASSIASAQAEAPSGAIVSLVDVDFAEYRRKNDMRVVKKNCTIPSWLNFEAERAGVNFSAVLQAALKSELHITSR